MLIVLPVTIMPTIILSGFIFPLSIMGLSSASSRRRSGNILSSGKIRRIVLKGVGLSVRGAVTVLSRMSLLLIGRVGQEVQGKL